MDIFVLSLHFISIAGCIRIYAMHTMHMYIYMHAYCTWKYAVKVNPL